MCAIVDLGASCLRRATGTKDVEFLRAELAGLVHGLEERLNAIPGAVERRLVEQVGSDDGQLLAPIRTLIHEASSVSNGRLTEVKTLLAESIDPARETSTLGSALKSLRDVLDERRNDSIQASVARALSGLTQSDGTLATTVRSVVAESVRPLAEELDRLALEVRGQHAADAALEQTPSKGSTYEQACSAMLSGWASASGAEVHFVGDDNKAGDIVVVVNDCDVPCRICIETRDRNTPLGRGAISQTMSRAMAERECTAGLYVSATRAGLANEIGDWAEGRCHEGDFVATTDEHLITAVRFVAAQHRLALLKQARTAIDGAAVESELARVRTALRRIGLINRKVGAVRSTAAEIQVEAEALREEVRSALIGIEDATRLVNAAGDSGDTGPAG